MSATKRDSRKRLSASAVERSRSQWASALCRASARRRNGRARAQVYEAARWGPVTPLAPDGPKARPSSGRSLMSSARRQLLKDRARLLRHRPTHSEELLWSVLRARQLGVTFRRQLVIGRFIVDFAAQEAWFVVEVDGGYHQGRSAADARRDAELKRRGWRVVRFTAEVVKKCAREGG